MSDEFSNNVGAPMRKGGTKPFHIGRPSRIALSTQRQKCSVMRTVTLLLLGSLSFSSSVLAQLAPGVTATPQPLARDVMYRILFRQVAAFQAQASQLAAQFKPSAFVADYHQNALQLSPQATQLINVAVPCVQQMKAIDQQAAAIIDAVKKQYKGQPKGPNSMVPLPPPQLSALEAQRTALILAAADTLASEYGPAQFAYFENTVRLYVGSNSKISSPTSVNNQ